VRAVRTRLELTQARLAEQIGVSFATVNRWENGQAKPTRLAWQQIVDLEGAAASRHRRPDTGAGAPIPNPMLSFMHHFFG
jgi:type I restriction enzyme M protein